MNEEEIEYLKKTIVNPYLIKDKIWIKAFEIYNKNTGMNLQMACIPCYYKVLKYIIDFR